MSKGWCNECGDTEWIEKSGFIGDKFIKLKFCSKCGGSLLQNIKTKKSVYNEKDIKC